MGRLTRRRCQECGRSYLIKAHRVAQKYCSRPCAAAGQKRGEPRFEATIEEEEEDTNPIRQTRREANQYDLQVITRIARMWLMMVNYLRYGR